MSDSSPLCVSPNHARALSAPPGAADDADAPPGAAADDDAEDDDAARTTDDDAARMLTPKERGISKKAPALSEKEKAALAKQWKGYADYMDHQRTQGWKT